MEKAVLLFLQDVKERRRRLCCCTSRPLVPNIVASMMITRLFGLWFDFNTCVVIVIIVLLIFILQFLPFLFLGHDDNAML